MAYFWIPVASAVVFSLIISCLSLISNDEGRSVLLLLEECMNLKAEDFQSNSSDFQQETIKIKCNSSFKEEIFKNRRSSPNLFIPSSLSSSASLVSLSVYNSSYIYPTLSPDTNDLILPTSLTSIIPNYTTVVIIATCNNFKEANSLLNSLNISNVVSYILPCEKHTLDLQDYRDMDSLSFIRSFLIRWFVYKGWNDVLVLYGTLIPNFKKRLKLSNWAKFAVLRNIRLTFDEIPLYLEPGQNLNFFRAIRQHALNPRKKSVVILATKEEILYVFSEMNNTNYQEFLELKWLLLSNVSSHQASSFFNPDIVGEYFYAKFEFEKAVKKQALKTFRQGLAMAKLNYPPGSMKTTKVQYLPVIIYKRKVNFKAILKPPIKWGLPPNSSLPFVPLYKWIPPTEKSGPESIGEMWTLSHSSFYNLHGMELQVITINGLPFMDYEYDGNSTSTKSYTLKVDRKKASLKRCEQPRVFFGYLKDILDLLSREMNFTYHLYTTCDGEYGSFKDGRWTGVIGELVNNKAHVGLANLAQSAERSKVVDFPSVAITVGGAGIMMKRPTQNINDMISVYLMPFTLSLWIGIIVFIPISSFFLALTIHKWREYSFVKKLRKTFSYWNQNETNSKKSILETVTQISNNRKAKLKESLRSVQKELIGSDMLMKKSSRKIPKFEEKRDFTTNFFFCYWFTLTAIMQQGHPTMPIAYASRFVYIFVWVTSVVLYAAYTSNLISFFTVSRVSLPVNNLKEIVQSNMLFGARTGSVYISNLKESPNPVHQEAYERLQSFEREGKEVFFSTTEDAIERILNGSFAFISDYVASDYYQKGHCNLVMLKEQLFKSFSSFVVQNNSPLNEPFSYYLKRFQDGGVLDELQKRWWKVVSCDSDTGTGAMASYKSLGLNEVISSFAVLGCGIVFGIFGCLCEYFSTKVVPLKDVIPEIYGVSVLQKNIR